MSVLMTQRKADAIASVTRDRSLLTDSAERDRVLEAECKTEQEFERRRKKNNNDWVDFRMRVGK